MNSRQPFRTDVRPFSTIVWAGLAAGVLDIGAAITQYGLRGVSPVRILQSVAGGLLGRATYQGGAATAALGLGLHFTIAFAAAAVFYLASRRMAWLTRRAVPAGLIYGALVHLFMQTVVLPLSRAIRGPFEVQGFLVQLGIHMLFVGLPIALVVRRFTPCPPGHTPARSKAAPGQ